MLSRSAPAVAVAAVLGMGCGEDGPDPTMSTRPAVVPAHVGSYALYEVDGQPIPLVQYADESGRLEFAGGELTLLDAERWKVASYFRATVLSTGRTWIDTATGGGTYRASGPALLLTETNATTPVASVTVTGGELALTFTRSAGTTWRYRRAPTP